MTEQKIRMVLAGWGGWTDICEECGKLYGVKDKYSDLLPNYPNDLNAVHELEKKLIDEDWEPYLRFLVPKESDWIACNTLMLGQATIKQSRLPKAFKLMTNATASQRCEALLRTLGKWKD